MRVLYISCHSVLEADELTLFTELGHDVFSLGGAYSNPQGNTMLPRPGIPGMIYHEDLERRSREFARTEIPEDFLNNFDLVITMHLPEIIDTNWKRFSRKNVIFRSIGQSKKDIERMLASYKEQRLKIIRYSPKEALLPNYAGQDRMIRFYKDPDEWKDWNGNVNKVINVTQSLKGRGSLCHYEELMKIMEGFPAKIYGNGNEDLGMLNGGAPDYGHFKEVLRDSRVFVYTGTWPAPYTLGLIEAMMTGIPVVAIGKDMAQNPTGVAQSDRFEFYEVHEIIKNGENGYVAESIEELRKDVEMLLGNHTLAKRIGEAGRQTAINLFGKEKIKAEWKALLDAL